MTPMAILRRKLSARSSANAVQPEDDGQAQESRINHQEKSSSVRKLHNNPSGINEELKYIVNKDRQKEVLIMKLEFCGSNVNFESSSFEDMSLKDNKRKTLLELVEYLNAINQTNSNQRSSHTSSSTGSSAIFSEDVLKAMVNMVALNIFVDLSPQTEDFDPEEDEPVLDPCWPHKQVVFEFLLRLIISPELNTKLAKKRGLFDQDFLIKLILLFETEDNRERDYLKSILHRLYGKFFTHRRFIREQISFAFSRFIDSDKKHHGIAELLEILGSIINGFSLPLKKEHLQFLRRSLLPLHKSRYFSQYQQQLSYCVAQFIEKDKATGSIILKGLISCWPWSSSQKQVLFISEVEELLEAIHPINETVLPVLQSFDTTMFLHLSQLVTSDHFQVAERALFLWNNQNLSSNGCLSYVFAETALPIIYPALNNNMHEDNGHWNETVSTLSERVLMLYKQGLSESAFREIVSRCEAKAATNESQSRAERWKKILVAAEAASTDETARKSQSEKSEAESPETKA